MKFFYTEGVSRLRYAPYDLPTLLEHLKQKARVLILEQPFVKEQVYVFRGALQLEFLEAGMWDGAELRGTIVVGPCIRNVYHPQLLREMGHKERLPLVMQQQLQQSYNTLTMVDEAKLQAISSLLINVFTRQMREPRCIEIALPSKDGSAVNFTAELEQDRELIERRYENENQLLHAITRGDPQVLKTAMEKGKEISWPYRHPNAPVRSMKNLSLAANSLFRKAAESGGVHPLYLDSISGKFAIQIEQAHSIAEVACLYDEMPQAYCHLVRELSMAALSSLVGQPAISLPL